MQAKGSSDSTRATSGSRAETSRSGDAGTSNGAPVTTSFLYFHDEAVSFAAGHRPCAECRRASYNAYRACWAAGLGVPEPSAKEMNRQLHAERLVRGTHRRRLHAMSWADLPDGSFVLFAANPAIVIGDQLREWTRAGYRDATARPSQGTAEVITPPSSVAALRAGDDDPVQIDASAR